MPCFCPQAFAYVLLCRSFSLIYHLVILKLSSVRSSTTSWLSNQILVSLLTSSAAFLVLWLPLYILLFTLPVLHWHINYFSGFNLQPFLCILFWYSPNSVSVSLFETGFLYVVLAVLELCRPGWLQLRFTQVYLPSARIKGVCHPPCWEEFF